MVTYITTLKWLNPVIVSWCPLLRSLGIKENLHIPWLIVRFVSQ